MSISLVLVSGSTLPIQTLSINSSTISLLSLSICLYFLNIASLFCKFYIFHYLLFYLFCSCIFLLFSSSNSCNPADSFLHFLISNLFFLYCISSSSNSLFALAKFLQYLLLFIELVNGSPILQNIPFSNSSNVLIESSLCICFPPNKKEPTSSQL